MKTTIKYECDICHKQSEDTREIIECEDQGMQKSYPKGMIFGQGFCIIKKYKEGHYYSYSTWACRDTNLGDNFGNKEYCGFDGYSNDIIPPNKNSDAYKRMKKGLIKKGIKSIDYKKGII